jgi:D-hydroxyproline dehydrogenase subunit alpha
MTNSTERRFAVLVVGGGPAGLAAAVCAAEGGLHVGLVDDNPGLGGQIWRGEASDSRSEAGQWAERLQRAGVSVLCGTRILYHTHAGCLLSETSGGVCELHYQQLILATGARERFLPFPGWTLPNVLGAGGLQALVKSGLPIAGKRVVVAGSGPLLLTVAAYLQKRGAEIPLICEQASWGSLARFTGALLGQPQKIRQGLGLRKQLANIPFAANSWPIEAEGDAAIEAVVISRAGNKQRIPCDYLACGFHLVPNRELAGLLGCKIDNGFVEVDDFQQTSVQGVYCVGEPTGIGGVERSLIEGQIAGLAAAGKSASAEKLFAERKRHRKFGRALEKAFRLRPELRALPLPETLLCRCEDVSYSRVSQHSSWRVAKLQTRCGMGPCQGRICGSAAEFLFDWPPEPVRPPIFPTSLENLAATRVQAK